MEIIAVGMPRSGSRMFHDLLTEIGKLSGAFAVPNPTGHGRQHQMRHTFNGISENRVIFGIHRDLRDVAVSYAQYVLDHHKIKTDDPDQLEGPHPLWHALAREELGCAIDVVLEHPGGLQFCVAWLTCYQNQKHCHLISFEDLVCDTMSIMPYFRGVGLEIDHDIIWQARENTSFEKHQAENPIHYRDGIIGKWERVLTEEQLHRIRQLEGGTMCQTV